MIDPAFLEELDRFDASLKRKSTDLHQGEQESPDVGEGLTFSDYRRYAPGDDIRLVDWRLYARTEEFFVKQFEEERSLTVHVLVDASGSMDFGEGPTDKFEFAAKLGLGFAYLTAEDHNAFRVSIFRDGYERLDSGRSNRAELLEVIERFNAVQPSGEADFRSALETYAASIRSRSLLLIASDFLADPEEIEAGVAALSRNDVALAQVLTPRERKPEVTGDTIFEEPETGTRHHTYFGGTLAGKYGRRLEAHVDEIDALSRINRAEYALVDTGQDFFDAFSDVWVA